MVKRRSARDDPDYTGGCVRGRRGPVRVSRRRSMVSGFYEGSLFDEPSSFDRGKLAARLQSLAARNIFIGGSSWRYQGWLDQIYSRSRYQVKGRFSKKLFEATCLREYAETFPTV